MAARAVAALVAVLTSSACAHRPLDLLSAAERPDGDIVDLSTPFPFSSTVAAYYGIGASFGLGCSGWGINASDQPNISCVVPGGTGISFFISYTTATGTYASVSSGVDACNSQGVWATYAGDQNLQVPMSGTLTVTSLNMGSTTSDTATIDGSYDVTVQDGSGLHFAGDFHSPPCTP